jgi:hypothetical protein
LIRSESGHDSDEPQNYQRRPVNHDDLKRFAYCVSRGLEGGPGTQSASFPALQVLVFGALPELPVCPLLPSSSAGNFAAFQSRKFAPSACRVIREDFQQALTPPTSLRPSQVQGFWAGCGLFIGPPTVHKPGVGFWVDGIEGV